MSLTTAERWIWQSSGLLTTDTPGGGGTLQVAASNATLAARENNLVTLWEDAGSSDVNLDFAWPDDPTTFRFDAEDAAGGYNRFVGLRRIRTFGELGNLLPRIELHARGSAPSTFTLGIIIAATAPDQPPRLTSGYYATATTTSTSVVPLVATLDLYPILHRETATRDVSTGSVVEMGTAPMVSLWVGAWCTSGSGGAKAALYGLSVYLRPPSGYL